MKVLIVSDSHGRSANLEKVIQKVSPIDLMLHLGDFESGADYISLFAACPVEIVAGNNDFFADAPKEKILVLGNHTILMTHGHRYGVNFGTGRAKEAALQQGADILLYGHTHKPSIDLSSSVWAVNPGSISQPRQENGKPSYIIMDIDPKGMAHFTLNYLS
jgi:putative phosphoesterase